MGVTIADTTMRVETFIEYMGSLITSPIPDYEKIIYRAMRDFSLVDEYDSYSLEDDSGIDPDSLEESQKMLFDFLGVSQ